MFDLESEIAGWRRRMTEGGVRSPAVLEEMESHLRDDIDAQTIQNVAIELAFHQSLERFGRVDQVCNELNKVHSMHRVKSALFTLAGIPSSHPSLTMNPTNSLLPLEPRWATYSKAAVFLAPAVLLWIFTSLYLLPKLRQICQVAGVKLPWVYQINDFIEDHSLFAVLAAVLPFVLLEWRWDRWPQFRRVSLGGAVFLLNATVLVLIALTAIFALYAAPQLMSRN